jgi:hypothetical protein
MKKYIEIQMEFKRRHQLKLFEIEKELKEYSILFS